MLKPFFQGKLDTFCAIYAVLNALRLTHGIRALKARDILNETLMAVARSPEAFKAVLLQETDYINLVDGILRAQSRVFPLEIIMPFAEKVPPSVDELWRVCQEWLQPQKGRAVIFRFVRYLMPGGPAMNKHWTTADRVDDSILHLFDCSHEAEAVLNVRKDSFVTVPEDVSKEKLLYIQPHSMRLVRLPF